MSKKIYIRFPELELGDGNQAAMDLNSALLDEIEDIETDIVKDDPTNQDFGATLAVLLGTPAVLALAKGIAIWISRQRKAVEIEIDGSRKTVRIEGGIDEVTARVVEALAAAD